MTASPPTLLQNKNKSSRPFFENTVSKLNNGALNVTQSLDTTLNFDYKIKIRPSQTQRKMFENKP